MLATQIPQHEKSFHDTGIANGRKYNLIPGSINIPGTNESMPYIECRPVNGGTNYYYSRKHKKQKIVLHFTAGYLQGDLRKLTKPDYHVSVPFVIGRNGHIYNLFPSADWSYHLGKCTLGDNIIDSRRSIGIELSNIGPLILEGDKLRTTYNQDYCSISENEYYTHLQEPYRGYNYFASFTQEQYKSFKLLLRYVSSRYQIPLEFLPTDIRYATTQETAEFKGIVSHVNFRKTNKWDIGPAFNWNEITT